MTSVVAVTGAGSGIGLATALLYAERGYRVVAVDVDAEGLAKAGAAEGVETLRGDVADPEVNEAFVALALERFGRLDAVVLNAGFGGAGPLDSPGAIERFDRIIAVNLRGVALGVRAALPAFRAAGGGAVVATSSVSGLAGDPATWAYNAAKAGVINLVRGLAIDYAVENIRVNAIAPGGSATALTAGVIAHPELGPAVTRRIPLQRWSEPREQAEAIFFLTSPAASYITGVTLPVDGGLSANGGILLPPAFPGDAPH
ncbi:NAD(P)-dependent dehydrogenase (short-subunit alcohol dehydrogenase family) [Actinocorallia herbida]|uniref:NAD(P)-dependent dehydrogenase (Short-subunit alcohol dehydrogenase family) n=1 Tax=Actinocorallia herbida TaxID=58109 RepID=A0A3N1CU09_9ACTN|nr:SDR family oxidoreductase [Actinocorallia herbida]ROO84790.1 NAD(P)-dependent dehydrogenase (short-subunit alcohol dehydrogenase family) [Actinocorallia herbida]